jgi:predicted amidohydrolase
MRLACVQSNVAFGNFEENLSRAVARLREMKHQGVDLVVFPETYLTGYCVDSNEDAVKLAMQVSSSEAAPNMVENSGAATATGILDRLSKACDEIDILAVVGFAEREGTLLFNTAALLEPGEAPRYYRKSHLPDLGFDKFVQPGSALEVFETRLGKIGILICYDLRPPEAARVLALKGAELIVLPTNWPMGAEVSAEHIAIARAAENRVFIASCNRTGEENGFRFIGRSKIVHPTGRVLAAAGEGEEVIVADLDLAEARQKRTVAIPGRYETDVFTCRQPDLYRTLIEP